MSSNRKDARWGIALYVVENIMDLDWNEVPYARLSNLLLAIDGILLCLPESVHARIKADYYDKEK